MSEKVYGWACKRCGNREPVILGFSGPTAEMSGPVRCSNPQCKNSRLVPDRIWYNEFDRIVDVV